jgi:hypothetical protein
MQTLVSVVTGKEWKMLGIPFAAGTEAPFSSVMGKQRCRRIESTYPIVSPQRNRVSPYRSSEEVESRKADNDDVGIGNGRKRKPPCNGTDRGCVAWLGQHHLAGNGADFSLVLGREAMGGTDEGSNANDDGAGCWCSFPYFAGLSIRV